MKRPLFVLLFLLSACATSSHDLSARNDGLYATGRHPAESSFPTSHALTDEMENREAQFYKSQSRVFARMAATILENEAHATLPAEPLYHRPDLFNAGSYSTLTLDATGRQLFVSATTKSLDESTESGNIKIVQLGDKYQYTDTEMKALFAESPYQTIDITGGVSMEQIARQALGEVVKVLAKNEVSFQVVSSSKIESGTSRIIVNVHQVNVSAASRVVELANGELCRISDRMIELDRSWTVLCLKDNGLLSRPRLDGVFGAID